MQLERPANFPAQLDLRLTQVTARLAVLDGELTPEIAASIARVASISDFVVSVLLRQPEQLIARLLDTAPLSGESLRARIDLSGLAEHQAMSALRRFRQIEMARIAWRDYSGWADLKTNLEDLSTLADTLVQVALDYAAAQLQPRFGRPRDKEDRPASLLVLGMGKLGGRELNYSSDIDLVFLYPEQVVIDGQAGEEAEAYFRRVAQLLIKLLDQVTDDGFVFRVDTRLRPFGTSGPLVVSIAAFESYLTRHGRDWERYAYVKARLLTGLQYHDELFNEILTPFVYRRYLDYGVFGALRQMKKLISEEVQRKDMANNIKLGPGGIREIEFIVQTFQLVRGGRDPALVTPSLLIVLPRLADLWQHAEGVAADLMRAYAVLRITENRLQAMDDRQSHELPKGRERRDRLAYAMNEPDWEAYMQCLNEHRLVVETEFNRVAWEAVNISVEGEFDSKYSPPPRQRG